jgi:hypothetical protein
MTPPLLPLAIEAAFRRERLFGGGACVNGRSIEERNHRVLLIDQERDLGAPEDDGLCALRSETRDDSSIRAARLGRDDSKAQLLVDDPVNSLAVFRIGNDDAKAVRFAQPVAIERLFHREPRTEQANHRVAGPLERGGRRICDVEQWDRDGRLDGGRHLVHRVRAQNQEACACPLKRTSGVGQDHACTFPITDTLEPFDLMKVDAVQDDLRRMQTAQAFLDRLVDLAVVRDGRLPAHPADQADGPHEGSSA